MSQCKLSIQHRPLSVQHSSLISSLLKSLLYQLHTLLSELSDKLVRCGCHFFSLSLLVGGLKKVKDKVNSKENDNFSWIVVSLHTCDVIDLPTVSVGIKCLSFQMLYRHKHKCDRAFYEIVHASSVHVNVVANVLKKELQNCS